MFQIVFNELSAAEMSALPKKMQLDLLGQFHILPEDLDRLDSKHFGVIEREGKKLYRYRAKDYRIYFEQTLEGITIHRVLHKNTFRDFLFRSKLPVAEDQALGKTREFWKLIDEGKKTRKA
jgi:mRNA-degrading endonuclease RelE of RelBE toxin-antitoxin system